MTEIRFEKVKKNFGNITVIRDLNITIRKGEFFTFVGPSGCGKSTILNLIAGLEEVTEGNIYFDSTLINDLSPKDRDVAMVFQSYALYPHMTVFENIAFPLRIKKIPNETIDKEVKRITLLLGLEDMLQKKPKELSGGQRQRVALGRAIIRKPKVFLMDEPLSNLDARLRLEMRTELKSLSQELKITTIYVTHDQAEAMGLSDRIAVFDKGVVQQCGTPLEVYKMPTNTFVAAFIGSPTMNFIEAEVSKKDPFTATVNDGIFSPHIEEEPEDERVLLGIRPDDAIISLQKSEDGMEIVTELVEVEGAVTWVSVMWKNIFIKGKMAGHDLIYPGMKAFLKIPDDKIHVFDCKTKNRL